MSLPLTTLQRIAAAPFDASTTLLRFELDGSDDHVTLPAGVWTLVLESTTTACFKLGSAASVPTDKAAAAAGFVLTAGASVQLSLDEDTALHGIMRSGTGTLWAMRQVA